MKRNDVYCCWHHYLLFFWTVNTLLVYWTSLPLRYLDVWCEVLMKMLVWFTKVEGEGYCKQSLQAQFDALFFSTLQHQSSNQLKVGCFINSSNLGHNYGSIPGLRLCCAEKNSSFSCATLWQTRDPVPTRHGVSYIFFERLFYWEFETYSLMKYTKILSMIDQELQPYPSNSLNLFFSNASKCFPQKWVKVDEPRTQIMTLLN